jgi:uncharacterized membrane-anchored protein YitT (DUF2179 family)
VTLKQLRDYAVILLGTVLQVLAYALFLIPAQFAPGGVSGAAQIINGFTGWPIGAMTLAFNIPLFVLGWRFLGGRRFLARTLFSIVLFSFILDGLTPFLPKTGLTPDPILNALYGALLGGIGSALIFRAQGTAGGTEVISRLLSRRYGLPLSQSYLYTDTLIVLISGLAFSWSNALYAMIVLYAWGVVTDLVLEGQGVVRTAIIITDQPEVVSNKIIADLARGVTAWPGTGMYSGQNKQVLLCVISRAEVGQLKAIIHEADANAFVVIGQAHEALGEGFKALAEEK